MPRSLMRQSACQRRRTAEWPYCYCLCEPSAATVDGVKWSASRPVRFFLPEKGPHVLDRALIVLQNRFGRTGEYRNLCPSPVV